MKYDGKMPRFPQYFFATALLLTPCASAAAQEPIEETIPAVPLVEPGSASAAVPAKKAGNSIAAMPLMKTAAQSTTTGASSASAADFTKLETTFNADYAAWVVEITALSGQEGFTGAYPENPTGGFYAGFRTIADQGNLQARLWCLRNFQHDTIDSTYRKLCWQGEAFSLATALRNDVKLSNKLRQAVGSGWQVGGAKTIDKVLAYIQDTTEVEEIRRATMMARSRAFLDMEGESFELGRQLADEVVATWPDSDEAVRLAGMLNARDTLVLGGTPANFTGKDVDGNEINLYDYRGKIVVIDFWGFW